MALGPELDAPHQRRRLMVIVAAAGLVFVVMFFHWFTATSPYGDVSASAWSSMAIGRLLLAAFLVIAGMFVVQVWLEGPGGDTTKARDGAHVLVVAGGVAGLFLLLRLVAPPHFAEVRDAYGFTSAQDGAATDSIQYGRTLAAWVAFLATATVGWLAYLIARDLPGGFDARHAFELLRSRSARRLMSWRRGQAPASAHVAPTYVAAEAEEKIVERS